MVDLQKLYETLEKIKKKIEKNKELFMKNENAVRYALINPFLEALGWDITDPDDVFIPQFEARTRYIPDYILKKNGKGIIMIGAKALYENEEIDQYLSYKISNDFFKNINYFITTDGVRWEIYEYKIEDWPTKRILLWDIEKEPPEEVIRKALSISNIFVYISNQGSQIKEVSKSIFNENLTSTYEDTEYIHGKIKLWIGDEGPFIFDKYYRILVQSAEWLIKNKYITEKDLPIKAGYRTEKYLINVINKHGDGQDFINFKRLSNGWYLLVHYNLKDLIKMTKYLLERYGKGVQYKIEKVCF